MNYEYGVVARSAAPAEYVMLSVAKHLLFLIENNQKQILRCAQNDIGQRLFNSRLNCQQDAGATGRKALTRASR